MKNSPEMHHKKRSKTFLELLEPRIAPAGLAGIKYIDLTLGTPQLVKAGYGLKANGMYLMAVTQGEALVYSTDLNGSNHFDANDITGIAAGNGLKMTSFVNINGDIVTDLQANGTLSSSTGSSNGHDGQLLLNSKINAITLRSVTAADVTPSDLAAAQVQTPGATAASIYTNFLAPSTYSINGNIYAGGGIGDGVVGDGIVIDTLGTAAQTTKFNGSQQYYQIAGIAPSLGAIKTGTAAGGNSFSFGIDEVHGSVTYGQNVGGTLKPYIPGIGVSGGDIIGLSVGSGASTDTTTTPSSPVAFSVNAIVAGNGGIGAAGGSIVNVTLDGSSGGLRVLAGNGGDGPTGGAGGAITNLADLGSIQGVVQIQTGSGGMGFVGNGGSAGGLSLGQFLMNGNVHINLGNGGSALVNAGSGSSFTSGTIAPTDATGFANAVSIITTYRAAGDIGTPKLIDFNHDGYADVVFVTSNPNQIGIAFGSAFGITESSPTLYLAAPGFSSPDTIKSSDIVVGDFNGATYADGTPILDVAVASSIANNTSGISVFMNPGNDVNGNSIWATVAGQGATGGNFVDSSIHVPLPTLFHEGFLSSGGAINNLVAGDFNHDGTLDLAYTQQVFGWNGSSAVPLTTAVMLSGTGDGHFFADFNYNNAIKQDTNMPVLSSGGLGGLGGSTQSGYSFDNQGNFSLEATAAVSGNTNSDVLVLTGTSNKIVQIIQDLTPAQQAITSSFNGGYLFNETSYVPSYDVAIIKNGAITGFNTTSPATPLGAAVTTVDGSLFDAIVLDSGNAITSFVGAYSGNGVASFASSQGVVLTGDQTLLGSAGVKFTGIVAGSQVGSFGGTDPAEFALYSSDASGTWNGFEEFNLAAPGKVHAALSYHADLSVLGFISAPAPLTGVYDAKIQAFGVFNTVVNYSPNGGGLTASTTQGFVTAMQTSNANGHGNASFGLINGVGLDSGFVSLGLNTYALGIQAGNGGTSFLGSGGAGGSIGSTAGTTTAVTITQPATLSHQLTITLTAGTGGDGLVNGGKGGGFAGLNLNYASTAGLLGGEYDLYAANGGDGFFGKGGDGGSLSNFQVSTGRIFVAGDGGTGYQGGNGGTINGTAGTAGYSTYSDVISLTSGRGGDGVVQGGAGGNITGFATEFMPIDGGVGGSLWYHAGVGGDAVAGAGGAGGSILNDSPISKINNLNGPIVIAAGSGGNGLSGGAGGAVSNFVNQTTASTVVSVLSVLAGNGGIGVSGNGGLGGSISNVSATATGVGLVTDPNTGFEDLYQFNRVIAGAGGASYGAAGGNGGTLSSINSTAGSSSEVFAAGVGGAGLTRGGAGGAVTSGTAGSNAGLSSKVLVIAGAGGNAYAALSTASNVGTGDSTAVKSLIAFGPSNGIGGNGGNISNFLQQGSVDIAVDLIAGNGGSIMNYGLPGDPGTSNVGKGGSLTNTVLAGNAGNVDSTVAIVAYNNGDTTGFVQDTLVDSPSTQLTDSLGNVGVVVGSAGSVKGGLPATDTTLKTGSVTSFNAKGIMSMVAGSVNRIAAINSLSGVVATSGVYGSYKDTPVTHTSDTALYLEADGTTTTSAPVAGGILMDGAIYANTVGGLSGLRVF